MCPTCNHTMQAIGCRVTDKNFYWCPRCGTIKPCEEMEAIAPDLIARCRKFTASFPPGNPPSVSYSAEWKRLGIDEAINTTENRPQ